MSDEGGVEREYRGRRKMPWLYLLLMGGLTANVFLQSGRVSGGVNGWAPWVMLVLMVLTVVRIALERFRAYTRVTTAGVTVQGRLRRRTWSWHEVYDIRVEPAPRGSGRLAPRWLAYLYDSEGRRVLLRHLDDWQLDDPYTEVSDLCLAAAPHRALAWERSPRVEELILRGAARRKAWTWAAYGALGVLCAMFFVDIWLIVVGRPEHPFLLFVCVPLLSFGILGAALQQYWSARPPRSLAQQP
ncbi:PH domain-containing protein [Streptomyces sp. NPDC001617]